MACSCWEVKSDKYPCGMTVGTSQPMEILQKLLSNYFGLPGSISLLVPLELSFSRNEYKVSFDQDDEFEESKKVTHETKINKLQLKQSNRCITHSI